MKSVREILKHRILWNKKKFGSEVFVAGILNLKKKILKSVRKILEHCILQNKKKSGSRNQQINCV